QGISTKYISNSNNRITTTKTRIICRNQQMMRLDSEVTNELNATDENNILRRVKDFIIKEKPDVMIFEDYNKGVLTNKIIEASISYCKEAGIITAADPKRKNFFSYKGVDIFKPNLKEVNEALNIIMDNSDLSQLKQVHAAIGKLLNHKISLITLSEKGIFWMKGKEAAILPGYLRNIADVSGAGDTVIATASLMFAVTKNIVTASVIANIAGGLVCEEVGTIAIDRKKLLAECSILMK
ncbi:MAG: carbohydrate kinase, partial [Chitinophagaceae bacterium]